MIRLFTSHVPVIEMPDSDEQDRPIEVPKIEHDPDIPRLQEALDRLDRELQLLRRGDHPVQRG